MDEGTDLRRLATLIVEALEIGNAKQEWDVGRDLARAFGLNLEAVVGGDLPLQEAERRTAVADALSRAAPSPAALLNELVRCGGRFVTMLDEVYAFLSDQVRTTEQRAAPRHFGSSATTSIPG